MALGAVLNSANDDPFGPFSHTVTRRVSDGSRDNLETFLFYGRQDVFVGPRSWYNWCYVDFAAF